MPGFKFRVLLDSSEKEEVFRDIFLSSDTNFSEFYDCILKSFDFSGQELGSFYVSNEDWDKGQEISSMDMSFGEDEMPGMEGPAFMGTTTLGEMTENPDQKFILVYDFMRMWIFLIELIEVKMEGPDSPEVILAVGNPPAEDSKDFTDGQFTTERADGKEDDDDEYGFDEYENGFDSGDFDNIDDYDI